LSIKYYIIILHIIQQYTTRPTIVEDVSYQTVRVQVPAVFLVSQFGICGRQRGTVTCFNRVLRFSPVSTYSPMSLILLFITDSTQG